MRVLLGSGGFRTPERIALLSQTMRAHFGRIERLLFVPYALRDHDGYVATTIERGIHAGYVLDPIHRHADPRLAVEHAQGIFVGGGNTFRLLKRLAEQGLLEVIRARVAAGLPYLGISAGCNVACPTIRTTNDMPIVEPPSLRALSLVPFQVNAHYFNGATYYEDAAGERHAHFGETRDERLREFHEENATPVVGLWEGGLLDCRPERVWLVGTSARLFVPPRPGQEARVVDVGAETDLWPELSAALSA